MLSGNRDACLACITDYFEAKMEFDALLDKGSEVEPDFDEMVVDSITVVPAWEQKQVGGHMIMACVMKPSCLRHLSAKKITAIDRAIANGGLAVPGLS